MALISLYFLTFTLTYMTVFAYDFMVVNGQSSWKERFGKDYLDRPIAPGVAITVETTHQLCGHKTIENLDRPEDWTGRPFRELMQRYPEKEGWQWELRPGNIIFSRSVTGLCADDSAKRHLGVSEGVVAVIVGPPGVYGGIDRLTNIEVSRLPEPLRRMAEAGWLTPELENDISLYLDGMDESNSHK
ncbi:hypothetical protein H1S01_14345 [Heliobacterium chlorum]|uniref:Uncharacterized protein n=1 Tax=Heliobacterium chlorum TaxID=2698 RepID=A0ABR7T4S9_HELCL|nr:hypothetical protein [Heliobacterium chlorum]MBC9785671.1 hypothetical protein [Heliobacterium chlorum]